MFSVNLSEEIHYSTVYTNIAGITGCPLHLFLFGILNMTGIGNATAYLIVAVSEHIYTK